MQVSDDINVGFGLEKCPGNADLQVLGNPLGWYRYLRNSSITGKTSFIHHQCNEVGCCILRTGPKAFWVIFFAS